MGSEQRGWTSASVWALVLLVVGVVFLGVYGAYILFASDTDNLTAEAEGYVSRVEKEVTHRRGRTRHTYLTYVTFSDSDHRTFTARSVVNGSSKRHDEGDNVIVYYDPKDPAAGCLISGDEDELAFFWALKYIFGLSGAVCVVAGCAIYVYGRFRRTSRVPK